MKRLIFAFSLIFLLLPPLCHGQVYKCVDEEGNVRFTNIPGPGCTPLEDFEDADRATRMDSSHSENLVKALLCTKGGTIGEYLNRVAGRPEIKDLGWKARRVSGGGVEIERILESDTGNCLEYRWRVTSDGRVKAINNRALAITRSGG